jgi:hypothetical protein
MKQSRRIFLLFFILAVTPFMRGCGESFGFPLPFASDILLPESLQKSFNLLVDQLLTVWPVLILLVNILCAIFMARMVRKYLERSGWDRAIVSALSFHLLWIWLMVEILMMISDAVAKKWKLEAFLSGFGNCFQIYFYRAPNFLAEFLTGVIPHNAPARGQMFSTDPLEVVFQEILVRVWFVLITALVAFIIYRVSARIRSKGKP